MIGNKSQNTGNMIERLLSVSPIILTAMIFLTPDIRLKGIPAIRFEQIFIAVILIAEIITYGFKRLRGVLKDSMIYFAMGMIAVIVLTIVNGQLQGYDMILNDFFELYKVYIYFGTYIIVRFKYS